MTSSEKKKKRAPSKPWKRVYGVDRKYTARVNRLRQRLSESAERPTDAA